MADSSDLDWLDDFARRDGDRIGNGWVELRGDWKLAGNAVEAAGGPGERIVAQLGFELGRTFSFEATMRTLTPNYWNGVAFNLVDSGDGTQDYYAVRLVTRADSRPPSWQLLQVTRSIVDSASLIAQGPIPVVPNSDYTIRVGSSSYGVVNISILDGSEELLAQPFVVPLARLRAGGHIGLYSSAGRLRVDDVRVTTSRIPADPPSPGPLTCPPVKGIPYELPDESESITETSRVDLTWSGHLVGMSLLAEGAFQYAAYYDVDRRMTVAQRDVAASTWVQQPLDSVVAWDSHNYVTMAVDSEGHLHVSGNMHGVPLVYFRTTRAGDVTSLEQVPVMVDAATEQRVTYPRFFRNPDDELIFRYRDGSSGNGVDLYNIYDATTRQWRRLLDLPLHDGEGLRNAYVDGPVLGPDGQYHLAWVWRDTGDAATNQHVSYARSRDLVRWERSDGRALSLPLTYDTSEVVDPVPMNGGVINGNTKIGFDARNRVIISYHKYDDNGNTQIYVARRESSAWLIRQVSAWEGRWTIGGFGSLIFEVSVSPAVPLPDGNLRLDFRCHEHRRTWILNRELRPIAEVNTPRLPAEISAVRSDFPGMVVNVASDLVPAAPGADRYVMRWESRPQNQDRPWDPPHPEPSPLEVYRLGSAVS